jgi:excisionase family DNA binding protein
VLPRLLTLDEVADALGVSRRTVERLVHSRVLTSAKVRGARRVSEQAVAAYVERVEIPATVAVRPAPLRYRGTGRLGEGPDPLASSRLGE